MLLTVSTEVKALKDKVAAFNILVHRLPEPNFELLATVSRYLVSVVDNAAENRMHERNRQSKLPKLSDTH